MHFQANALDAAEGPELAGPPWTDVKGRTRCCESFITMIPG